MVNEKRISIRKIINLTKIFILGFLENLNVIDSKTHKFNKKSILFWAIVILAISVCLFSYQIIHFLNSAGKPQMFLNIFLLLLTVLFFFQTILVCLNIFYFSKDLENVLSFPIKPIELFISKFNTVLFYLYLTEFSIGVIPLLLYGFLVNLSFTFLISSVLVLVILPLLPVIIVTFLNSILMNFSVFIKNKDFLQIIITMLLVGGLLFVVSDLIQNLFTLSQENIGEIREQEISQGFLKFNDNLDNLNNKILPFQFMKNCLVSYSFLTVILNVVYLVVLYGIMITITFYLGQKVYLKQVLNNIVSINDKEILEEDLDFKIEKNSITKSYIKREFNILFSNSAFFIQCVLPISILVICLILIARAIFPSILAILQDEQFSGLLDNSMNIEYIAIVLGFIQILIAFSNISITALTREGKNATFLKTIPIQYYKQFQYKTIPQIFIFTIIILLVIFTIKSLIPEIEFIYLIVLFVLGMLLNILNSYIMTWIDFSRPNLEWDVEYKAIQKNKNKFFQYVFLLLVILLLNYFIKIFTEINIWISISSLGIFLIGILFIIDRFIKRKEYKLFYKVN